MFCQNLNDEIEESHHMSCGEAWLQEILAFLSLICSLFVLIITVIKFKKNLLNNLIIHILISEIIDEINILLSIFMDVQGKPNFENYHRKMIICFSQIFIAVFSCLWTLTASFFISLKLYDVIINKNKIFKDGSFMSKYTTLISIAGPTIISYIIWLAQTLYQANEFSMDDSYKKSQNTKKKHFRMGFCWVNKYLSITLFIIATILIAGNIYFSLYKGFFFIRTKKKNLKEKNDESINNNNQQISKMSQIQTTLFLYPTVAGFLWALFFLFKLMFEIYIEKRTKSPLSWIFSFYISIRQITYIVMYFITQPKLRRYAFLVLTFQVCKKKKKRSISFITNDVYSINPIVPN